MEMFHRVATQAPPELTCVLVLRNAPPAPWLPKEVHGKPVAIVVACHAGAPADGESLVAPIKSFGQPVGDVLQRRTYTSQQSLLDATQPKGRRYYWKSEYLPTDSSRCCSRKAAEHAGRIVSPHTGIVLFQIDGALNRLAESHSAGNRDAGRCYQHHGGLGEGRRRQGEYRVGAGCWADVRGFSTGGTINFSKGKKGGTRAPAGSRETTGGGWRGRGGGGPVKCAGEKKKYPKRGGGVVVGVLGPTPQKRPRALLTAPASWRHPN